MKEKLIIKNFGPIKSVELDLGRFNILIGEQATGKSTVAKVLAVCQDFRNIIWENSAYYYNEHTFIDGLRMWGIAEYMNYRSSISYTCKHYQFTITADSEDEGDFSETLDDWPAYSLNAQLHALSPEFQALIAELEKLKPEKINVAGLAIPFWRIPTSFLINEVARVINDPFYLPTERGLQSLFSLGQASLSTISNFLYSYFAAFDDIAKTFKQETEIAPLNIIYINQNGHGFIRKVNEEGKYYSLNNAANGYQSTIPVVLAIKFYNDIKKKNKDFIIEEPELNLFPDAQNRLMKYLVGQIMNGNNTAFLNTHSPYTLTSVNNMMYAYSVGKIDTKKAADIVDKRYWLNPEEVSAYLLNSEGGCENIFDREEGMINTEMIDRVSTDINQVFDKLLKIEFSKNEPDN